MGCTVRLAEATTQCGFDDDTVCQECYVGDSWFSSLKTVIEMASRGFNYVGQVKQCHKNFPKEYLEKFMENMSPGNWTIMRTIKPMTPVEGKEHLPDALCHVLAIG